MSKREESDLKSRILGEMTVDHSDALDRNFHIAKQFIQITKEGKVHVLCKDALMDKENILLYLIGKLYAKRAELADTDAVKNKELMDELGKIEGSISGRLTELRDENKVVQVKRGYHVIPLNLVERTLKSIERKIKKAVQGG